MSDASAGQTWTMGLWHARPGREADFIKLWTEFAAWTCRNQKGGVHATILQDISDATRFVSFGPWDTLNDIASWRETEEFKAFVAAARDICESLQPNTLRVV